MGVGLGHAGGSETTILTYALVLYYMGSGLEVNLFAPGENRTAPNDQGRLAVYEHSSA